MNIIVNGKPQAVTRPVLSDALIELGYASPAIATALNGAFVAKTERETTNLRENDRLDIVAPMQGG